MTRFPTYPPDILSRADAFLASKYPDGIVDPLLVEVACEAMMAVSEWQDISTAPKDGLRVLTFGGGLVGTSWHVARFAPQYGDTGPGWYSDQLDRRHEPTHWQPLPAPPSSSPARE